ncbi:helix-turn-helix transcriptional regulator [Thiolapillus sp.]|uniref:helix-turn-helix transcriptional regulator n=1 Tax=Thiolapillus sp. TaxID=2017437 RepID=UPI003AF4AD49
MINQQNINITQAKELAEELAEALAKVIAKTQMIAYETEINEKNIKVLAETLELTVKETAKEILKKTKDINEDQILIEKLSETITETTGETLEELTELTEILILEEEIEEEEIEKEVKKALAKKLEKTLTQGIKTEEKTKAREKAMAEIIRERENEEWEWKSDASKRGWETRRQEGTDKKKKLKPIKPSIQWLTAKETMTLAEISRTTMYKKIKAGEFPKPIKIGKKSLWVESEINDWIKEQMGLPTSINI